VPSNLIKITLRGQHSSEAAICYAQVQVSLFLDQSQSQITVPVFRDDVVVGDVKFELLSKKMELLEEVTDKKHPHVLSV